MSLEIKNLRKEYGNQVAVNDLSFKISNGEIVGFLGPNGAGKSTTMKMISGNIEPTSGTATVCGLEISENPIEVKKLIGYLPEHNPLYYDMYVKEYLSFIAGIHKIINKKEAVNRVIKKVGLEQEAHKKIGQLSKGYKQRVGIAQAIIHNPKVLILDEPTSGLDTNQLEDIRNLIKELGKDNIVILSTHIMQEVEAMCDRVLIINKGTLITDNQIDKLKTTENGEFTIEVTFENEIELEKLDKIKNINKINKHNSTYTLTSNQDVRKNVFLAAIEHNWVILEMKTIEKNVENIFKQMTNK